MRNFLLIALGVLLVFQNVHSNFSNSECGFCLVIFGSTDCNKREGVNLPSDGGTLADGIHEFPPKANQSSKHNSSVTFNENGHCSYTENDAKRLLGTIRKVVAAFYSKHAENINMRDGGVGLGILKHQLSKILKEHESNMTAPLKAMLSEGEVAVTRLARKIMNQANAAITDPTRKFGAEVWRNFSASATLAKYNGRKTWKSMEAIEKHFGEFNKIGDEKEVIYIYLDVYCIVTLIDSCSVPHVCQKMNLEEPHSQYMLMHQVLYQALGKARGCAKSNAAFRNVEEFKNRLCSKAYLEAQFLEKNNFPTRFVDLFAEQVAFCGVVGYESFMRADWLREILSWLGGSESGCALDVYEEKKTTDAKIFVTTTDGEQEACLVHLTSISLAALAMNLRYMFDTCSSDIFKDYFVSDVL